MDRLCVFSLLFPPFVLRNRRILVVVQRYNPELLLMHGCYREASRGGIREIDLSQQYNIHQNYSRIPDHEGIKNFQLGR